MCNESGHVDQHAAPDVDLPFTCGHETAGWVVEVGSGVTHVGVGEGMRGLDSPVAAVPADVPGYPDGDHLLAAYGRQSDLDLAPMPWYLGFAFFKIAAIVEGIHFRAQQGLTVGDGFQRLGQMLPDLVERGHAVLSAT